MSDNTTFVLLAIATVIVGLVTYSIFSDWVQLN
jgi:hypothetical protein